MLRQEEPKVHKVEQEVKELKVLKEDKVHKEVLQVKVRKEHKVLRVVHHKELKE